MVRGRPSRNSERECIYSSLLTLAAKYIIFCSKAPFIVEAMKVLGVIGYCEKSTLPRLSREMPNNSICLSFAAPRQPADYCPGAT